MVSFAFFYVYKCFFSLFSSMEAALGYDKGNSIHFECAGTIISDYHILTVAHCARDGYEPIVVRVGQTDLADSNVKNYHVEVTDHKKISSFFYFYAQIFLSKCFFSEKIKLVEIE